MAQKPSNQSSPNLTWVITLYKIVQNFVPIKLGFLSPTPELLLLNATKCYQGSDNWLPARNGTNFDAEKCKGENSTEQNLIHNT